MKGEQSLNLSTTPALIRAIAGAPLTVLIVLLLPQNRDRSLGNEELRTFTGYSTHTIADALRALAELQLAQNHGRYHGWTATVYCRQLILGETEDVNTEVQILHLPPSSSSSTDPLPSSETYTTTTNSTRSEEQKLHLESKLRAAGIYPGPARALATDDWTTPERIDAWIAHLARTRPRSPAAVLCQALTAHTEPPAGPNTQTRSRFIEGEYAEWIDH
jgi:hypothetical protein